jgi:hypothetical protein
MVHMMIVVDRQKDLTVHAVPVIFNVVARWLRQFGELAGRIDAVEAFDEAPNFCVLTDSFARENTKSVNGAFSDISFNEKHG